MENRGFVLEGFYVGHATDRQNRTGCTAILCPAGAVGGVDVRGAAPGTRETDLLKPGNLVERAHCVMLSGGSAFGLEAACGAMDFLREKGIGLPVGVGVVPIVPSAVLFDLSCGAPVYPDKAMGRAACEAAFSGEEPSWGCVGAGTGATVGKAAGPAFAMNGGIGYSVIDLPQGGKVACIVAVNAVGDVVDENGTVIAGMRAPSGTFVNTEDFLLSGGKSQLLVGTNTTIGAVLTDVALDKAQANRLATVAHDGYARAIHPVHTQSDGDTIFALSCGDKQENFVILCTAAAKAMAQAIRNAVTRGERL